jgi:sporulation protein YlmC with PRC-barrel domain
LSDGRSVGQLDRVVVDPRTKEVNYIVVRKGALFTTDKVVPLTLVAQADVDGVTLREDAGDLEHLPVFEERYYVPAGDEPTAAAADTATAPTIYSYPPVVGGEMAGLGNVPTQSSMGALTIQQPVVERTERAIPDDNVAIRSGARVMSIDGKHVGSVEQVLTGQHADEVSHFVISRGLLFKDRKLVPMGWVSEIGEDLVQLAVDAAFLDRLEGYNPPS